MNKQKILALLKDIYNETELWEIYKAVDQRIIKLQDRPSCVTTILKRFEERGFICLKDPIEVKDPTILLMDLYADVYVYTYGDVNKKDLVIDGLSIESGTWVEELDFDDICDYDQLIVPKSSQAWDYGNYGDPYNAIANFKVQVLYKKKEFPGNDFRYIDTDGKVKEMKVKDTKLYTDDKYFGDVEKWDTYNLFVL